MARLTRFEVSQIPRWRQANGLRVPVLIRYRYEYFLLYNACIHTNVWGGQAGVSATLKAGNADLESQAKILGVDIASLEESRSSDEPAGQSTSSAGSGSRGREKDRTWSWSKSSWS